MTRKAPDADYRQPTDEKQPYNGTSAVRYAYSPERGLVPSENVTGEPETIAACDSWYVCDGRVRALERHRQRFTQACAAATADWPAGLPNLRAFWDAAVALLPRRGRWFPRVQLSGPGQPGLWLLVRPAPQLTDTVRLWLHEGQDRRRLPRRKGPDLSWLGSLRSQAIAAGASEAVLTSAGGLVLEGATTSLLWWQDDCLCLPSPRLRVLPGVTSALLTERARQLHVQVAYRRAGLDQLARREVWAVNALHGIRPVAGWAGAADVPAGPPLRAAEWRRWLEASATRLPATAARP